MHYIFDVVYPSYQIKLPVLIATFEWLTNNMFLVVHSLNMLTNIETTRIALIVTKTKKRVYPIPNGVETCVTWMKGEGKEARELIGRVNKKEAGSDLWDRVINKWDCLQTKLVQGCPSPLHSRLFDRPATMSLYSRAKRTGFGKMYRYKLNTYIYLYTYIYILYIIVWGVNALWYFH